MIGTVASWVWEDSKWIPTSGIPLSDRGFRHGMSAFETLRIHCGKLVAATEHLEKLRQACLGLGFRIPQDELVGFSPGMSSGIARIYVTAGDGHFHDPLNLGRIYLQAEETILPPLAPLTLTIGKAPHVSFQPGIKTGNYWPNIAANREATTLKYDEILLVNSAHHVISASLANVFAMIDGLLLTPRVSSGARAGVVRDWVIARADVIISDFHPGQLSAAEEIFLTNSGYGIAPIASLNDSKLSSQTLGRQLCADYQNWLDSLPL